MTLEEVIVAMVRVMAVHGNMRMDTEDIHIYEMKSKICLHWEDGEGIHTIDVPKAAVQVPKRYRND